MVNQVHMTTGQARLDCDHVVTFKPRPAQGDVLYCQPCGDYRMCLIVQSDERGNFRRRMVFLLECGCVRETFSDEDQTVKVFCSQHKRKVNYLHECEWKVKCESCRYSRSFGVAGDLIARVSAHKHHLKLHHTVRAFKEGFPKSLLLYVERTGKLDLDQEEIPF